jgi:hypothetical protein
MGEQIAEYERGLAAGLERARALVMGAPVLFYGQRTTEGPDAVPRIMDTPTPNGNPRFVSNTYALRDAVLHWIEKDLRQIDGWR